jgi:predicted nucleic acid-binding protein
LHARVGEADYAAALEEAVTAAVRVWLSCAAHRDFKVVYLCLGRLGNLSASRLRAADACYVWAAQRRGLALCTLDAEILARSVGIRVYAP